MHGGRENLDLRPTGVFLGVWVVLEVLLLVAVPGYPGVLAYGVVVAVLGAHVRSYDTPTSRNSRST